MAKSLSFPRHAAGGVEATAMGYHWLPLAAHSPLLEDYPDWRIWRITTAPQHFSGWFSDLALVFNFATQACSEWRLLASVEDVSLFSLIKPPNVSGKCCRFLSSSSSVLCDFHRKSSIIALKGIPHLFSGCQGFIWLSFSEPHTPTERHPRVLAKDFVPNPLILTYVI